jgi:hypothetical protein
MVSAPMDALASIGDGRKEMIVSPNKGLFFVATAAMCSAALYAAEISSPSQDPLRRVFVGIPNQLALPPAFPEATTVSAAVVACDPSPANLTFKAEAFQNISPACTPKEKPAIGEIALPGSITDVSAAGQEHVAPASLSTAVQTH